VKACRVHDLMHDFILKKCEEFNFCQVKKAIGNFLHLKYLSLRGSNIKTIPKSIGNLQNLETLDLKLTNVTDLPVEVYSLTKLCYLNVLTKEWNGVKLEKGVGNLTALQKLAILDASDEGGDIVGELKKLKQLSCLKIENVGEKDGISLCNAIESMTNLRSLHIGSKDNEILELESLSSPPPHLERLYLYGSCSHVQKVPDWVFRLKNLISLELDRFKLRQDQLCLIGHHLPELILLASRSFKGDELNIKKGWFGKLKSLLLTASSVKTITIDEGSLPSLQQFHLELNLDPKVVEVPDHVRELMVMDLYGEDN
ncbi:hypothetical protein PIB30_093676, partial [Stylosanthes scabra]|nr:hypothetical protein [Stylosanthes scabra]